jgi:hypothetical protein
MVVGKKPQECDSQGLLESGLCRYLGHHPDPAKIGTWLPLLFINGTSVETGRRIIIGDLYAGSLRFDRKKPLFPLAYDLCEIGGQCDEKGSLKTDIRSSTAATLSARFPVLSPYGTLRNSDDKIVDRIVDGGYFENGGLATAADIAESLTSLGSIQLSLRSPTSP